jgi:predicted unusual protein kinase regulating ubiquinone biosynthesis (AarF/ABC1/UbiB family)
MMTTSRLRARYWRIVLFFGRIALSLVFWEIFVVRIGLGRYSRAGRSERDRRAAVRFRALALSMGGLMIKVGQFLSARMDVLPPVITKELADLQDEVPAEDFAAIRAQAEAEFGQPLSDLYAWVDETPLAAASLGQVHRARLRESDAGASGFADVVVKVQRPHIEQVVEVDLAALRRVGGWLQRYKPVSRRADVPALVEEFATTTRAEIDYLAEAGNAGTFAAQFAVDPGVRAPRVVPGRTTRRVLTLEDVSAIKISDYEAITAAGIERPQVAHRLLDAYLQQIFDDGAFHADPHPGNLFVTPLPGTDEAGHPDWALTFIDFGMMGRVPDTLRTGLREVLLAVVTQDGERLVRSFSTLGVLLPGTDLKRVELATVQLFDRFGGMTVSDLKEIDRAELLSFGLQFQELLLELPFQLPENMLLIGRSVAILSGMCTGLDPDFNLWAAISPYTSKLVAAEGTSTARTVLSEATKILGVAIGLPRRVDRVLTQMERGEFAVRTPLLDLRVRRLERATDRQTLGLIFAALLVSGSILHGSDSTLSNLLLGGSALTLARILFSRRTRHSRR